MSSQNFPTISNVNLRAESPRLYRDGKRILPLYLAYLNTTLLGWSVYLDPKIEVVSSQSRIAMSSAAVAVRS